MTDDMTDTTDMPQDAVADASAGYALLIELDYALLAGLPVGFEACKAALAGADIELTPVMFGRFLLGRSAAAGVAALLKFLGRDEVVAEGIVEKLDSALATAVAAGKVSARDELVACVKSLLADDDWTVGILTGLQEDAARLCLSHLGLESEELILVAEASGGIGSFSVDAWLQGVQRTGLRSHMVLSVASSANSCRGALGASTNVVALVDPLTEFQDYTGVDTILDSPAAIGEAVEMLKQR